MDDFLTGYSNYGGDYLAGGFIPPGQDAKGEYLYLVADAEKSINSTIWELKLLRNGKLDSSFFNSSMYFFSTNSR